MSAVIQFAPEPGNREAFDRFLRSLFAADWDSADGPLRFSPDLTLSDLADADFLQNARLLLAALDEAGGTPATATGNLNRAFVRQMVDRLVLPGNWRETIFPFFKVLNEPDVWVLHICRIVVELAGLAARRQKRFQLTRAGRDLLPDSQAGPLYRKLFLAHFRRFHLHYIFPLRDVPGFQRTLAVILWRLDTIARGWTPVGGLGDEILLPGVLNELHAAMVSPYDNEEWILGGYVLDPLVAFGLLERRSPGVWPFTEKDQVRTTPLWRKFIHFEPWASR